MRGSKRGGGRGGFSRRADHAETPEIYRPRALWPHINLPTKRPFSSSEKDAVNYFISFRKQMRDGPLYTFLASDDAEGQAVKRTKMEHNPFEGGMVTYTKKFAKPRRTLPKLDERKFGMMVLLLLGWAKTDIR